MESGVRKALGKGLEALFPAPEERRAAAAAPSELAVPVHEIVPNPEQPRRHFDDEALGLLADSIRRHGLLQPLVVRRIAGRYELIAGERRLRAARRAGLERVPVIVREARVEDRLELALIENVQRENLTPLEEAEAYRHLIDTHGLTQEDIAARVGHPSRAWGLDRDRVLLRRRARRPRRPSPAGSAARLTALTLSGNRC